MKYTKEQMEIRVINYLMKTSKHLFLDGNGKFFKLMLTKDENDRWIYITVRFNGDKCDVKVKPVMSSKSPYHTQDLAYMRHELFPQWEKRKTIPYFKDARAKMYDILKIVRKNYDGSKESLTKINTECSEVLMGMEFKKAA